MRIQLQENLFGHSADKVPAAPMFSPHGKELEALQDSPLKDRFYSWMGASGNLYVCTVFLAGEESTIADLPNTVVVGVARNDTERKIVCFGRSKDFHRCKNFDLKYAASTRKVSEWHVHFATDFTKFCEDLSATMAN